MVTNRLVMVTIRLVMVTIRLVMVTIRLRFGAKVRDGGTGVSIRGWG